MSTHMEKKRPAYRLYITFCVRNCGTCIFPSSRKTKIRPNNWQPKIHDWESLHYYAIGTATFWSCGYISLCSTVILGMYTKATFTIGCFDSGVPVGFNLTNTATTQEQTSWAIENELRDLHQTSKTCYMHLWFTKTISPKKAYCCMAQTEQKKEEEEEEEKETSTKFVNLGSLLTTNRCTCNQFTVTCRIV
jgi:hypothetical protein